jgi:hypothetical protein
MTARLRPWIGQWLAGRRRAYAAHRQPAPLRQSAWCANGLHGTCTGHRWTEQAIVDCRCPCHHDPFADPAGHQSWPGAV